MKKKRTVFWLSLSLPALFVAGFSAFMAWQIQQEKRDRALLEAACGVGSVSVRRLLEQGANPNARDNQSVPPKGWLDSLRSALGLSHEQPRKGASALTLAVLNDNTPGVQALLEWGARDVDARLGTEDYSPPISSATLLMVAATNKNEQIVKALLDRGAKLHCRDSDGKTALFYAVKSEACFRLLLARGADVTAHDDFGVTLLIWTAQSAPDSLPFVLNSMPLTTDVNARDEEGMTALHWACFNGSPKNVRLLLKRGGEPNAYNNQGRTGLTYARSKQRASYFPKEDPANGPEIIRLLKQYGAKR